MPDILEPRDIELMRRLSTGDEGAFLEFYRRHQGGVYRYAVYMTGRPEAAADVVQETFLTLIRQAWKFDEEKGAPGAFLYGIARNHVRKLQSTIIQTESALEKFLDVDRSAGEAQILGWEG
jgi:RNA polymerase sigma-70 factor (ECF subfamily)